MVLSTRLTVSIIPTISMPSGVDTSALVPSALQSAPRFAQPAHVAVLCCRLLRPTNSPEMGYLAAGDQLFTLPLLALMPGWRADFLSFKTFDSLP